MRWRCLICSGSASRAIVEESLKENGSQGHVPSLAAERKGMVHRVKKGRFGETMLVTGKMVQIHHGAATVSGE